MSLIDQMSWYDRKRARATTPKLLEMIDYAESLEWRVIDGDETMTTRERLKALRHTIELNLPEKPLQSLFQDSSIPLYSPPSSPTGEEGGE